MTVTAAYDRHAIGELPPPESVVFDESEFVRPGRVPAKFAKREWQTPTAFRIRDATPSRRPDCESDWIQL